jgi:formamidopyrimidine-DNA glycosylase
MPEIPEIRAHAERLTAAFVGAELTAVRALSFTALKTFSPRPEDAYGRPLDQVEQRAKYLILRFGDLGFIVHLMQGGRLKPDEKQAKKPRGGLLRWVFADGRALLLTEPGTERRAGVWVVAGDIEAQEPVAELGPEATELSARELHALLGEHSMRLHGFLRDQRILSGLGRRLANEICHRAAMSPFAQTSKLGETAAEVLVDTIGAVVEESLAEERRHDEMTRSKDRPSAVHGRAGEPCPVCGDEVRAVEYRRYTVNYCPTCQTDGRILADNTTSKFLR